MPKRPRSGDSTLGINGTDDKPSRWSLAGRFQRLAHPRSPSQSSARTVSAHSVQSSSGSTSASWGNLAAHEMQSNPSNEHRDAQQHQEAGPSSSPHSGGRGVFRALTAQIRGGEQSGYTSAGVQAKETAKGHGAANLHSPQSCAPSGDGLHHLHPPAHALHVSKSIHAGASLSPNLGAERHVRSASSDRESASNISMLSSTSGESQIRGGEEHYTPNTEPCDGRDASTDSQCSKKNLQAQQAQRAQSSSQRVASTTHCSPIFQPTPLYALHEFEPLETLGTGTFGRVLLVRHRLCAKSDPRGYFALKVLNKKDIVRLKQVSHTNNERLVLSRVHHPFIVDLFCTYQDNDNCYMLMEYVVGGEVFSHLRRAKRFTADVTRFYMASLVLALAYLHSENVVYRDLKPENLLLDKHGYVKMADFGFAKELGRPTDKLWTLCGTPEYLSPEVIQSQGQSFASDYWALGVLMYEMLCGFPPFYDATPFATYEKILLGNVAFPPHVDLRSRDLILCLLTKDVSRRLGNLKGGALDVMRHPFFEGVDWQALLQKRIPAPIVPHLAHAGDSGNFQKYDSFDAAKMPALMGGQDGVQPHGRSRFGDSGGVQEMFPDF